MAEAPATTERLYDQDAYLRSFDGRVIARATRAGKPAVALDRTAFYPEGGGQPGDHGLLGGVPVLDTQLEDGLIWHAVATQPEGDQLHGEIDWARRFDFMQQHHGQHLLSAAFEHLYDARTVAVHLGQEISTVDLATTALSAEQLGAVEDRTNQTIWDDLPIIARFVDADELARLALRKQPGAYDQIRIVSAGDVDHSPCGGTHPRRTGEVGLVALRRWERRGETLRVEFVCGARVLRDYRLEHGLLSSIANAMSIGPRELPAAVERLRETAERTRKALLQAEEQLLRYEAAESIAQAEHIAGTPVVAQVFEGRELDRVRLLAKLIAGAGGVALLGVAGDKAQLVFARANGLPFDMGALLREAVTLLGGRGGGRPEAAQGGGPNLERLSEALACARERLTAGQMRPGHKSKGRERA